MRNQNPLLARRARARLQTPTLSAALAASLFAVLAMPAANAGTTLVAGSGVFNDQCQPPVGSIPANSGDYPPVEMSGSLDGCLYVYVSALKSTPSGTFLEQGTELFVGCLNGTACGTFTTAYTYTGKFEDDGSGIFGRCEHRIVDGTGDFAGAKGVVTFKDDVVNMVFDYRGQILLASGGQADAKVASSSLQGGSIVLPEKC